LSTKFKVSSNLSSSNEPIILLYSSSNSLKSVSFLSDGIIVLYNIIYDSGRRASALEILKMRGSSFKKSIVEMKITNKKSIEIFLNRIIKKSTKNNFNLT